MISDIMNETSKNIYFDFNGNNLVKKMEKELARTIGLFTWQSEIITINKVIKDANSVFTQYIGTINSSIMYLTDNLANVL